jgi:hypothetical protein
MPIFALASYNLPMLCNISLPRRQILTCMPIGFLASILSQTGLNNQNWRSAELSVLFGNAAGSISLIIQHRTCELVDEYGFDQDAPRQKPVVDELSASLYLPQLSMHWSGFSTRAPRSWLLRGYEVLQRTWNRSCLTPMYE